MPPHRNDIQILRGFAVLIVVLYHAGVPALPGGYLGVDIFFVVSGFLMMQLIGREIDAGTFSLGHFYLRRARRLLPAAFCTLLVVTAAAFFVLTRWEWESYAEQLFGALTFTANIVLWQQSDYFDVAAAAKPLLHFWSLSLEEQFYFVFPIAVLLIGARRRSFLILAAAGLSFALCVFVVSWKPTAAFYLLPTRAWELLLGAAAASLMMARPTFRLPPLAGAAGLAILVAVPFIPLDPLHPRLDALLVTLGTAAVIVARGDWIRFGAPGRVLTHIGDVSYSLYLIHWPLMAFATVAYSGPVPVVATVIVVVAAYGLAVLQHRFVEQRFRNPQRRGPAWRFVSVAAAGSIALVAVASVQAYVVPDGPIAAMRAVNDGFGRVCRSAPDYVPLPECQTSAAPTIALWGDSYAMQWAQAIADLPAASGGLVQITRSVCAPVLGLGQFDRAFAEDCISYNASALDYVIATPSIRVVVLSGAFHGYIDGNATLTGRDGSLRGSPTLLREYLGATIRRLQDAGKNVILLAPAASNGDNLGDCYERIATGLLTLGRANCDFPIADYLAADALVNETLLAIAADTGIQVLWPAAASCGTETCSASLGDGPLMHDVNHLSYAGAAEMALRMRLDEILRDGKRCSSEPADIWVCVLEQPSWLRAASVL